MPITSSSETFVSFVNDWFLRHMQFVQHLSNQNTSITQVEAKSLVTHFFSNCLQYYHEKSAAVSIAGDDIYDFFSPPWFSSNEKLIFWVGGFKPSIVFKLITNSINDLTSDQLESFRLENKRKERALMRRFMEEAMEVLKSEIKVVMKNADQLRCWTVEKVVEIMNPRQAIKLLRSAAEFYLRLRDLGVQIETELGHGKC